MTPAEFKSAVALTRMSLDGQATYGALLVLVDGKGPSVASSAAGCSRQAIATAISRLRRALKRCPYCGQKTRSRSRG